jgi:hypothetical protein
MRDNAQWTHFIFGSNFVIIVGGKGLVGSPCNYGHGEAGGSIVEKNVT